MRSLTNFVGCDPQQLSDGIHAPEPSDNKRCGAPLHSISMMNGVACYTGVNTGSTAFYYCACSSCSSDALSSVRSCQLNGTWNGTIPQCECTYITTDQCNIP